MKKILTDIFARIWACWGLVSFVTTFVMIFPASMISYFFPEPNSQRYFLFISRIWMNIWLTLVGCPLRIKGKHHFKKGEVYIVVYNHNTFLDVPLSCPYVPGPNKTIAKSSFAKVPLFGLFYKKGAVLVDRKDERSRSRSFETMKQVLSNGMHMCIYPEGTRNRTDQPLKNFYDGAFRLAKLTGHSIIPGIITGTREAMPVNRGFYFIPKKLGLEYLAPVSTEGRTVEECKQLVYDIMLAKIMENNSKA